jgi:hypothetical protein
VPPSTLPSRSRLKTCGSGRRSSGTRLALGGSTLALAPTPDYISGTSSRTTFSATVLLLLLLLLLLVLLLLPLLLLLPPLT